MGNQRYNLAAAAAKARKLNRVQRVRLQMAEKRGPARPSHLLRNILFFVLIGGGILKIVVELLLK